MLFFVLANKLWNGSLNGDGQKFVNIDNHLSGTRCHVLNKFICYFNYTLSSGIGRVDDLIYKEGGG
jgi:hypothetical protein